MHHALVVARAITAGMVGLVSSVSASTAGTGSTETVPIKDRIFFERGDWAREFASPPQPPAQAVEPAADERAEQPAQKPVPDGPEHLGSLMPGRPL